MASPAVLQLPGAQSPISYPNPAPKDLSPFKQRRVFPCPNPATWIARPFSARISPRCLGTEGPNSPVRSDTIDQTRHNDDHDDPRRRPDDPRRRRMRHQHQPAATTRLAPWIVRFVTKHRCKSLGLLRIRRDIKIGQNTMFPPKIPRNPPAEIEIPRSQTRIYVIPDGQGDRGIAVQHYAFPLTIPQKSPEIPRGMLRGMIMHFG